jgi:hypothetical protein
MATTVGQARWIAGEWVALRRFDAATPVAPTTTPPFATDISRTARPAVIDGSAD